ncbi:TIR domain-containing protein [Lactiplantibacillus plantarum]|uniref:TIR domain-containing protein n=1 Tax=Lactiplantibacillus plantarum TaxID=1590 RepID=UPI003D35BA4A
MPQLKNYRLLISHSWHYDADYNKIKSWLDDALDLKWFNHSVSADRPFDTKTNAELEKELTEQISGCSAIIVVSGMYDTYSKWINYEIHEAIRLNKAIIGIRPRGSQRTPQVVTDNADILVNWNSSSLISAVRKMA